MPSKTKKITLISHSYGYRLMALVTILLVVAEVIMQVFAPLQLRAVIDQGIRQNNLDIVLYRSAILIGLTVCSLFIGVLHSFTTSYVSTGIAKNIRNSLFSKVQRFSFQDLDKFPTGVIINRINSDASNIANSVFFILRAVVRLPIQLGLALVFSITLSKELSLIFVVTLPLLSVLFTIVWLFSFPLFKKLYAAYDDFNLKLQENLSSMRTIKSFTAEDKEFEKVKDKTTILRNISIKSEKILSFNSPIINGTIFASILALAVIGTQLLVNQTPNFEIGNITAFGSYIWMISGSLVGLMSILGMILRSIPSIKRVNEVLNHPISITSKQNAYTGNLNGWISFENVSFKYANSEINNLNNINLNIKAGENIAIIGLTGSGKSSLVHLIPRFYDVSEGSVKIDGINVKDIDLTNLTNHISAVFQNSVLFSGTIRSNLLWANKNATDEEMWDALEKAGIKDFVWELPDQLDHIVEQKAENFSGGQRQRLSIARALLKNPKILILDDATSAVDAKTENSIKKALKEINNCTKITIAQKINSIIDADRIVIMEDGQIQAIGKHEQLLAENKYYQTLYATQQAIGGIDEIF
ncbi:ABC transporter ATP-binding protein [Mycoplasma corogypsi]|uniref:ABC transporter ATP-binding protein n=1 Tax=Mycoplasma corogypsi TaxID=2106 RepID=UPI003873B3E4